MAEAINAEAAFKIFSNNLSFPNVALLSVIHSWSDNADVLNVTDRIYCCIPFIYDRTEMNIQPENTLPDSSPIQHGPPSAPWNAPAEYFHSFT